MATRNALIVRYKVFMKDEDIVPKGLTEKAAGFLVPVDDIISVGGLDLGEEGTVNIPEWNRDIEISNGKRKIVPIPMKYKLKGTDLSTHKFFIDWYKHRNSLTRTVRVSFYNRGWDHLFYYEWEGCEMVKNKMEDQELGSTKLGIIEVLLRPYDIKMVDSADVDMTEFDSGPASDSD